jgi:hypothetical protein
MIGYANDAGAAAILLRNPANFDELVDGFERSNSTDLRGKLDDALKALARNLASAPTPASAVASEALNRAPTEQERQQIIGSGRDAGLEEAAKLVEVGFDRKVAYPFRADKLVSKLDQCIHKRAMNEDCEQCCADAIRALAATSSGTGS